MRRFPALRVALVSFLLLVLALPTAALAAPAGAPTFESFLKVRTPRAPALLPDSSLLVLDRPEGVTQLYRLVPKAAPGAGISYRPEDVTAIRLTDFPDGIAGFSLSPDGRRVVLMHARGGDENTQLTLADPLALPGTAGTPVVSDPRVQAHVNAWLRDGSGFLYTANDESPDDFYLYRYDIAAGRARKLLGREGSWTAVDVSDDGRRVLVQRDLSASDVQCYELDAETGALRDLTLRPAGGTAACAIAGYLPGERAVLLLSDYKDGRMRLYARDLRTGAVREPLPALARFEIDEAGASQGRDLLAVVTNEDGYGVLRVFTLPGFRSVPAPETGRGRVGAASFRGHTLVWWLDNARTPAVSFASVYATSGGKAAPATRQLTWPIAGDVDLASQPLPELIRYRAFDGRELPAFLFLPAGAGPATPVPFIAYYHGGPEDQTRPGYNSVVQYLVSRGYGVIQPNVRGSSGYGRAYQMLDDYKHRWDSVRDGVDAAEWLVKSGHAAPGRIATYGGSYGGFMSVACVVEDEERVEAGARPARLFGACVDVVGIVNLRTFLEKTSGYRRKLREAEYGPLTDPRFLESVSSLERVDKIKIPVFIGHGFNDPRVPVEEAMQLAVALKDRGLRPRLFIAPDEGHGFAKLDNRIYFYERMATFLDDTIGSASAAAGGATSAR